MIDHIKALQQYLIAHKMQSTLSSLRNQLLAKYPQLPSNQLMNISSQSQSIRKKSGKTLQLSSKISQKSLLNKNKSDRIMECLLGKIIYNSQCLNNISNDSLSQSTHKKGIASNKIYQKLLKQSQQQSDENTNNLNISSNIYQWPKASQQNNMYPQSQIQHQQQTNNNRIQNYDDELDLVQAPQNIQDQRQSQQLSQINRQNNIISKIDLDNSQISIVSQPSFVLEQLNRSQNISNDGYIDDNDLGYYQYQFYQDQLINGCSRLTLKYGYPQKAIKKNSKHKILTNTSNKPSIHSKNKKKNNKFPQHIMFPNSNDNLYPMEYNGFIYDVLKMRVIFDREKTGYEETKDLNIIQGDVLAGRYQVQGVLGNGVFAKVIKATDLLKNQQTCLKMINNNKDFFDQALDEIKILRYINVNLDTDKFNILTYKGVFYHRQHLFIETDLLRDNLFVAYRKNPAFFSIPILKQIARQLLVALAALHKLHIMHADLKPENIMIKSYNPIQVKIVDLGNSCFFHDSLGQYVQSRSYRAPQVVLGLPYDEKIDIWSLGCIMAELWTKNVLFYNTTIQGMLARIQSIVGPWPQWMLDEGQSVQNYFSKENLIFFVQSEIFHILIPKQTSLKARIRTEDIEFINFLEGTLKIDPNFRLSAEQALYHQWLQ